MQLGAELAEDAAVDVGAETGAGGEGDALTGVGCCGEGEAGSLLLAREEEDEGTAPLVEGVAAPGDVAQGVVGGLMIGGDDAEDVIAAAGGGEQRLGALREIVVEVLAVEAADDLQAPVGMPEHEGHTGRAALDDGEHFDMGEDGAVGHACAADEQVVAAVEGEGAMAEQGAAGGVVGVVEQRGGAAADARKGEVGVVLRVGIVAGGDVGEGEGGWAGWAARQGRHGTGGDGLSLIHI